MRQPPRAVIHINFMPEELPFEPRRVWTALNAASQSGRITTKCSEELQRQLGETAIHIGTRALLMSLATKELKTGMSQLCDAVPDAWLPPLAPNYRVLGSEAVYALRDRVLLAIDSFVFEFRAFFDLVVKFAFSFLAGIGPSPPKTALLPNGKKLLLIKKNGELRTHDCVLYFCDLLKVSPEWFEFLATHRNFFTHAAAPYCAVEDRQMIPAEYDLLIMRKNIHDFVSADPKEYFRASEFAGVIAGVREFSSAIEKHLIASIP